MTDAQRKLLEAVGGKVEDTKPKTADKIVHIDREDFDLLDITDSNVTYYINEVDGTIKVQKGEF